MDEEEREYYEEEFLLRNEDLNNEDLNNEDLFLDDDIKQEKSFKEINQNLKILKEVKKHGISLGVTFNKEEQEKFKIKYGDIIDLSNAKIIHNK